MKFHGTNLQILINEARKLIEHAGTGGTIEKIDVDNLAIKKTDSVIFDLTDNLGAKKVGEAMQILDNLVYQKEPLQKILIMLYNHFKKLYFCKLAVKLKRDVATSLSLKPNQTFLVNKYKKQASYFTEEELEKILNEFNNLDYNSKIGKIDIDIGLRSILCSN